MLRVNIPGMILIVPFVAVHGTTMFISIIPLSIIIGFERPVLYSTYDMNISEVLYMLYKAIQGMPNFILCFRLYKYHASLNVTETKGKHCL